MSSTRPIIEVSLVGMPMKFLVHVFTTWTKFPLLSAETTDGSLSFLLFPPTWPSSSSLFKSSDPSSTKASSTDSSPTEISAIAPPSSADGSSSFFVAKYSTLLRDYFLSMPIWPYSLEPQAYSSRSWVSRITCCLPHSILAVLTPRSDIIGWGWVVNISLLSNSAWLRRF